MKENGDPLPPKISLFEDPSAWALIPAVKPVIEIHKSSAKDGSVGFKASIPGGCDPAEAYEAYELALTLYIRFKADVLVGDIGDAMAKTIKRMAEAPEIKPLEKEGEKDGN